MGWTLDDLRAMDSDEYAVLVDMVQDEIRQQARGRG